MAEVEWHTSHKLYIHTYSTFLQFVLLDMSKSAFILVIAVLLNRTNTSNRVILSLYIHTRSLMIQQMSCLSLIKTNNKPNMIDVSIDRRRQ